MQSLISPTGQLIRVRVKNGSGLFKASRDGGTRYHGGIDFLGSPGQDIVAPCDGKVIRIAYPYANDLEWKGVLIIGKFYSVKIFYLDPLPGIIGKEVMQGESIGIMQDIREK